MIQVSKRVSDEDEFLYINLHGFRDRTEQDIVYRKIQDLVKDFQTKIKRIH